MRISDMPWEIRNLGVGSSVEFIVGKDESWKDIRDELITHQEEYQVLHVQSGNTDVLMNASQHGFLPVEMQLKLIKPLDSVDLPRIFKRFEPVISCDIATAEEQEYIIDHIRDGRLFSTDRVSRDPLFGVDMAGRRYAYWTRDMLDNGATLFCMRYKDRIAAFDVIADNNDGTADALLGGVFPEFHSSGLGFVPVYFITKYAYENGYKKIRTSVSSNNLPILKIHEMFGYSVDEMVYCLIKHLEK